MLGLELITFLVACIGCIILVVVSESNNLQTESFTNNLQTESFMYENDVIGLRHFSKTRRGYDFENKFNVSISILNKADKCIKYITFDIECINPVNDVCDRKKLQGIGPVEPNSVGTWNWKDQRFFATHITNKTLIRGFFIIYTDGTTEYKFVTKD